MNVIITNNMTAMMKAIISLSQVMYFLDTACLLLLDDVSVDVLTVVLSLTAFFSGTGFFLRA